MRGRDGGRVYWKVHLGSEGGVELKINYLKDKSCNFMNKLLNKAHVRVRRVLMDTNSKLNINLSLILLIYYLFITVHFYNRSNLESKFWNSSMVNFNDNFIFLLKFMMVEISVIREEAILIRWKWKKKYLQSHIYLRRVDNITHWNMIITLSKNVFNN